MNETVFDFDPQKYIDGQVEKYVDMSSAELMEEEYYVFAEAIFVAEHNRKPDRSDFFRATTLEEMRHRLGRQAIKELFVTLGYNNDKVRSILFRDVVADIQKTLEEANVFGKRRDGLNYCFLVCEDMRIIGDTGYHTTFTCADSAEGIFRGITWHQCGVRCFKDEGRCFRLEGYSSDGKVMGKGIIVPAAWVDKALNYEDIRETLVCIFDKSDYINERLLEKYGLPSLERIASIAAKEAVKIEKVPLTVRREYLERCADRYIDMDANALLGRLKEKNPRLADMKRALAKHQTWNRPVEKFFEHEVNKYMPEVFEQMWIEIRMSMRQNKQYIPHNPGAKLLAKHMDVDQKCEKEEHDFVMQLTPLWSTPNRRKSYISRLNQLAERYADELD